MKKTKYNVKKNTMTNLHEDETPYAKELVEELLDEEKEKRIFN